MEKTTSSIHPICIRLPLHLVTQPWVLLFECLLCLCIFLLCFVLPIKQRNGQTRQSAMKTLNFNVDLIKEKGISAWNELKTSVNGIFYFMNMAATSLFRSTNVTDIYCAHVRNLCQCCKKCKLFLSIVPLFLKCPWASIFWYYTANSQRMERLSSFVTRLKMPHTYFILSNFQLFILLFFLFCFFFLFQCRDVHFINYNTAHWFNKPNQAPVISDKVC